MAMWMLHFTASKTLESTFEAPFSATCTARAYDFFADVEGDKVEVFGPTKSWAYFNRLEVFQRAENVSRFITAYGWWFRQTVNGWLLLLGCACFKEAASPVLVLGLSQRWWHARVVTIAPATSYRYRAAFDKNNELAAWRLIASAINQPNASREKSCSRPGSPLIIEELMVIIWNQNYHWPVAST